MTETASARGPNTHSITYASFSCHLAPNGGWLIESESRFQGERSKLLAAFSIPADLIVFLDENVSSEGLRIGEKPPADVQLVVGSRKP